MITIARVESELDCWFSASRPACSVLWVIGSPEDLVPAMAELSAGLDAVQWRAAACVSRARPLPFPDTGGSQQLLLAELGFAGTAVKEASSPLIRKTLSGGSAVQVVSAGPSDGGGIWPVLAGARGLQVCAGMFPEAEPVAEEWCYAATRLVMVAGTLAFSRGLALGVQDALLHSFLATTLQAGGIAVTKGGLEMCGAGIALTGSGAAIDRAEDRFPAARRADDLQLRHSVELAGPWASPAYRAYRSSPATGRWLPADP